MWVAALLVGLFANGYARVTNRPSAVAMLPGIILLVPGSVGFRSFDALLKHDVLAGINSAFGMILVAVSLVAGLLIANVAAPAEESVVARRRRGDDVPMGAERPETSLAGSEAIGCLHLPRPDLESIDRLVLRDRDDQSEV